jgi:hypothetical protein
MYAPPHRERRLDTSVLETLFALEVDFHFRLRLSRVSLAEAQGIRTSWALEQDYERLFGELGEVTIADVERLTQRQLLASDPRDVLAARDSLRQLFSLGPIKL